MSDWVIYFEKKIKYMNCMCVCVKVKFLFGVEINILIKIFCRKKKCYKDELNFCFKSLCDLVWLKILM